MIKLVDLHKIYQDELNGFLALKNINLDFKENEFVCVLGKSGSGKTTLLNIIGGLDKASSGHMVIDGVLTTKFTEVQWDQFRNYKIGFIFQNYSLIEHLSVIDNVMLSNALQGVDKEVSMTKALNILQKMHIEEHAEKLPKQLSGGERQRVSIARALVNDPDVILADEPTGSLDKKTAKEILDIIKEISKDKLVIMVTHSKKIASEYASRIIELKDGEVIRDTFPQTIEKVMIVKPTKNITSYKLKDRIKHAFNNIKMKKWRTFLTALGLAIGVSGYILIDGLSNGIKIQMNEQMNGNGQPDLFLSINDKRLDDLQMDEIDYLDKLKSDEDFEYVMYDKNLYLDAYKINGELQKREWAGSEAIKYLYVDKDYEKTFGNLVDGGRWPVNPEEIVISANYAKSLYEIDNIDKIWEKLNGVTIETVTKYYYEFPYYDYQYLQSNSNNTCTTYTYIDEVTTPESYDTEKYGDYLSQIETHKEIFNKVILVEGAVINSETNKILICQSYEPFMTMRSNEMKETKEFTIVGILDSYNANYSLISESEYLSLETMSSSIYQEKDITTHHSYSIFLKDGVDDLFSIKVKYREEADIRENEQIGESFQIFDLLSGLVTFVIGLIMFISIITAGIMLLMVLLISVIERSREIGILRSLGATRSDILSIFLTESGVIGFIAGIIGVILSVIFQFVGNMLIRYYFEAELMGAFNHTDINLISVRIVPMIISIFVCIFFASAFGLIPAIRASKKTPIEALKRI